MSTSPSEQQKYSALSSENEQLRRRIIELEKQSKEDQLYIHLLQERLGNTRFLLDESSDPIFTFHPDGTYRYVNRAFARGVEREIDEIIGHSIWDVFSQEEADKRYAALKWVFDHGEQKVIEVRVPTKKGDTFYITTIKPILNDQGGVQAVICISKDITERKRVEEELRRLSTHDALTGLYNRHFFENELALLQQNRHYPVSIVMADVDGLKKVNDQQGHEAGDNLLRRTAGILEQVFRSGDVVARIGGDEFAVILPGTAETPAFDVVKRLYEALEKESPPIRLSVGVATEWEGCTMVDLMNLADKRMYEDKLRRKLI